MASRSAISFSARYTPTSRTVVNPDSRVTRALGTDSNTTCDAVLFSCDVGSPFLSCAPSARCVWQSISPGNTVLLEKSRIFAPAGIFKSPPIASIFFPRNKIICLSSTRPFSTSITCPALIAVTASGGAVCCASIPHEKANTNPNTTRNRSRTSTSFSSSRNNFPTHVVVRARAS